jgi:hypothetical protein
MKVENLKFHFVLYAIVAIFDNFFLKKKIIFPKKEGIFDSTFICQFTKILGIFKNDFAGDFSPKKRESRH